MSETSGGCSAVSSPGCPVVICGSRGFLDGSLFSDADRVRAVGRAVRDSGFVVSEVLSGTARGADVAGEAWARSEGIPVTRCPADWDTYGRVAGPVRNAYMVAYAGAVIALWDGKSRGTANTIETARDVLGDDRVHVHQYR